MNNLKLHAGYIVIFAVIATIVLVAAHSWLAEHDARMQAEQVAKQAQQAITDLQSQQAQRTAAAAQKVVIIRQQAAAAKTPAQAAAVITTAAQLPAPIAPPPAQVAAQLPPDTLVLPATDVQPLLQQVTQGTECKVQLDTCTQNLKDQQQITAQLQTESAAWKKAAGKRGFWGRVVHTAKIVGLVAAGVAAGYAIHH